MSAKRVMSGISIKALVAALLIAAGIVPVKESHAEASAAKTATLPAGVAARVNGVVITEATVDAEVQRLKAAGPSVKDGAQLHEAAKSELVARELFRQAAEKSKLDTDPEVIDAVRRAKEAAMIQAYVKRNLKPEAVTEDQVKGYFEQLKADLGPTEYKARVIQLADEVSAKSALEKLRGGADFAELAKEMSTAGSKARGGELDWVSFKTPVQEGKTQGLPVPLAQALLTLKPGAMAPSPIQAGSSWYLLKLEQSRPTKIPDYEQAKPALRKVLEARAIEQASVALVKGLMAGAKIEQ